MNFFGHSPAFGGKCTLEQRVYPWYFFGGTQLVYICSLQSYFDRMLSTSSFLKSLTPLLLFRVRKAKKLENKEKGKNELQRLQIDERRPFTMRN